MEGDDSLLNNMNFSMCSCRHFLSNRKQSVMPKRAQESTSKEGSAVAKPRPMNLVSRNLLSPKKTSPQESSASNSPGNQELDQSYVSPTDVFVGSVTCSSVGDVSLPRSQCCV